MVNNDQASNYQPLHITRVFKASRQAVWEAWTQPKLFAQWFAPDMFTIPVCELDVRPGGALRFVMQGPDGTSYPATGRFVEVVEPEKLVFSSTPLDAQGNALFEVQHSVVFSEANGATTLDITSTVLSAGPESAPYLAGMEQGLTQALQKLAGLVSR